MSMANIADDISHAYQDGFNDGYKKGKEDAEFYLLHCGDTDEPQTNADLIRAMSEEDMARLFGVWGVADCDNNDLPCRKYCYDYKSCGDTWLAWLRDEVKDGNC